MSKHDCYIDTNTFTGGGPGWDYHSHPIRAKHEDGFIVTYRGYSDEIRSDLIGHWYIDYATQHRVPHWHWNLKQTAKYGKPSASKRYTNKDKALASLKKALARKGYRLVD